MEDSKKRALARSTSSETNDGGVSSIEVFVSTFQPFRVAPDHHIPMPEPYYKELSTPDTERVRDAIRRDVENMLNTAGIEVDDIISQCLVPKGPYEKRETIIVLTSNENIRVWNDAANEIQGLIDTEIYRCNITTRIAVEIRNPLKATMEASKAIMLNSAEHHLFTRIEDDVARIIEKSCGGFQRAIHYTMRGPIFGVKNKPTITIVLQPRSKYFWTNAFKIIGDEIRQLIIKDEPEIFLRFLPGEPTRMVIEEMKGLQPKLLFSVDQIPTQGSSIGPRNANAREAGSLGPFLSLTCPGGPSIPCALTCYHAIGNGPSTEAIVKHNDEHGIGLMEDALIENIIIDYPAPTDAKYTYRKLSKDISENNDRSGNKKATLEQLEEFNTFKTAQGFGTVIHAPSEYHINDAGSWMDWALIKLNNPTDLQPMRPAKFSEIPESLLDNNWYEASDSDIISEIGEIKKGDVVIKKGRTSGTTIGWVNAICAKVYWHKENRVSREVHVVPVKGSYCFGETGDSGSMVHSLDHKWVGMVIGSTPHDDATYVSQATQIRDDIAKFTGYDIELPNTKA